MERCIEIDSYKEELVTHLEEAWELGRKHIRKAQQKQKRNYDQQSKKIPLQVGDQVFLFVPSTKQGKAHKFARPFCGPYCIVQPYENGADTIIQPSGFYWIACECAQLNLGYHVSS